MATKVKLPSVDFAAIGDRIKSQFVGLNPNDPSTWPLLPRMALFAAAAVGVVALLWFVWLNGFDQQLEEAKAKEVTLKGDYSKKLVQAINLDGLKEQRRQVLQYVTQIEKQLPSKAEMDALLGDINKARADRGLQLDLFKPGLVGVREYYAELPIDLRVSGKYHQLGGFAADIAQLSRIVTLNNITVAPMPNGMLNMSAVAKTFRYLDLDEVEQQRKASKGPAKGAKK
jgi:type IV pilus assembly protein PilO